MKTRFRILAATLVGAMMLTPLIGAVPAAANGIIEAQMFDTILVLDPAQRNAISMLNHLAVLTQEIDASKNSRLYLEKAYSMLINNTYPNAVDSRTLSRLDDILDTLKKYRMVAVKRERLEYLYEQNRAEALRTAVPSPLGLMSAVQSFNLAKLAASVAYMAFDSKASYESASAQADMQYLQDGWALDEEEKDTLDSSRKGTFSYMVKIVGEYDLPGDLALSEDDVKEFVKWRNSDNAVQRIQFLESNVERYQALGTYWIVLAESYYEDGQYAKCLSAISSYEALDVQIFRHDYEYARILPLAVVAAGEVLSGDEYVSTVECYLNQIMSNTDYSDWASHYFAAQTYVELYSRTGKHEYIEEAFDVVVDNVNVLANIQKKLNAEYLTPVDTVEPKKNATKAEKEDIGKYNKLLKEKRKSALPPVYEPLLLNCELLFALAEELNIPDEMKQMVESILHQNGERIFLTAPLDSQYRFYPIAEANATDRPISFDGEKLVVPASLVADSSVITVTITAPASDPVVLTDWAVSKVERKEERVLDTFTAAYESAAAKDYKYVADSRITIEITNGIGEEEPVRFEYATTAEKTLRVFDSVGFVRVEE